MTEPSAFGTRRVFICGSALTGQPDHGTLGQARWISAAKSRPQYRMHVVGQDWHPAIYAVETGGIAIPGEVYEMTAEQYDRLLAAEPPHLYPADLILDSGAVVTAFFYPQNLIEQDNLPDISPYGGWAAYKAATQSAERG